MNTTTSKRGGARPGAGRPRIPGRMNITLSVSSETADKMRELRERGYKVNDFVADCISEALENERNLDYEEERILTGK